MNTIKLFRNTTDHVKRKISSEEKCDAYRENADT